MKPFLLLETNNYTISELFNYSGYVIYKGVSIGNGFYLYRNVMPNSLLTLLESDNHDIESIDKLIDSLFKLKVFL